MHVLTEFLPLILFLAAYLYKDIFFALVVLMIAMPIGLAYKYLRTGRVDRMYLWSTVFLLVLGAATLYFRDPNFLYWKPTAFNWVIGLAFLASLWIGDKPLVQRFFELTGEMPVGKIAARQWRTLNLIWVAFFLAIGLLNIYVAYNYSEDTWVKFKVFGLLGITFAFVLAQGMWIVSKVNQHAGEPDETESN